MKKLVLTVLTLTLTTISFAQIDIGLKAGVNYNFGGDLKEVPDGTSSAFTDIIKTGADNKAGFHAGLWFRFNFSGMYLRPEVVYTELKNGYVNNEVNPINTDFKLKKLDVPVLVGAKIIGPLHIYGGPALQYIIKSDFTTDQINNVTTDDLSIGLNFGAGVELGRLGVDVRWEKGFENELKADSTFPGTNIQLDNRPNQIIFSISYRLNEK